MAVETFKSSDGITTKYRFDENGHVLEVVHVRKENKHIICFPSQVGCEMGCRFCMAGDFVHNLRPEEMIGVCSYVLSKIPADNTPVLFSCMGVGEPSLNAESLALFFSHFSKINNSFRFAVSTLVVDYGGIMRLLNSRNTKFLLSVHAIDPEQRRKIFGFNPPLQSILNLLKHWPTNNLSNVELNYMLIEGINDSVQDAEILADMANKTKDGHKYFIKLNRFNPIWGCDFQPSSNVTRFAETLQKHGTNFETYKTDGFDIKAACGQLIGG